MAFQLGPLKDALGLARKIGATHGKYLPKLDSFDALGFKLLHVLIEFYSKYELQQINNKLQEVLEVSSNSAEDIRSMKSELPKLATKADLNSLGKQLLDREKDKVNEANSVQKQLQELVTKQDLQNFQKQLLQRDVGNEEKVKALEKRVEELERQDMEKDIVQK